MVLFLNFLNAKPLWFPCLVENESNLFDKFIWFSEDTLNLHKFEEQLRLIWMNAMNLKEYPFVFLNLVMPETMNLINSQVMLINFIPAFHHHYIRQLVKHFVHPTIAFGLLHDLIDYNAISAHLFNYFRFLFDFFPSKIISFIFTVFNVLVYAELRHFHGIYRKLYWLVSLYNQISSWTHMCYFYFLAAHCPVLFYRV